MVQGQRTRLPPVTRFSHVHRVEKELFDLAINQIVLHLLTADSYSILSHDDC